jgi:putative spermidine/putrescine transport system ATP-binding protein
LAEKGGQMSVVTIEALSKTYGSVMALQNVDLTVEQGEFVTLLGPSGSGKTTLLNIIAGSLSPSAGRLFLNGKDATHLPPAARGIGMVFQNYALMPHMTVFDNVAFPLRIRKLSHREIERRVKAVLELVQLPEVAQRRPRELSGGQQQRISLARCIVYEPSIILMDEPLGALDKKLRQQMQLEIKRLHRELRLTMLYVTHDQEEALTLSDHILLMNNGRIEQIGKPSELYFSPRSVFAADFIGESNILMGRITCQGEFVEVELEGGRRVKGQSDDGFALGTPVAVVVRPEHVVLMDGESGAYENVFTVRGCQSLLTGSVVKYLVDIGGGVTMSALDLNRGRDAELTSCSHICWKGEHCLVLRAGSAPQLN